MIKKVYSITIAVKDMNEAAASFTDLLGVEPSYGSGYELMLAGAGLRDLGVDFSDEAAVFQLPDIRVVLLTATDDESPVGRFLKKRGEGVFMVSLETDNVKTEVERLKQKGKKFVLEKNAEDNFGATNFIHPKCMNRVLFELFKPGGLFKD